MLHPLFNEVAGHRLSKYTVNFVSQLAESMYSLPDRYYHTLDHINEMLEKAATLQHMVMAPFWPDLIIAIVFHDIVYNATRNDNELLSAQLAKQLLKDNTGIISDLIMATVDHNPFYSVSKLLCDLDLMRLAAPWNQFVKNNDDIRKEYAHVPDDVYDVKRIEILGGFDKLDPIFKTDYFREEYEYAAHDNIRRLLNG